MSALRQKYPRYVGRNSVLPSTMRAFAAMLVLIGSACEGPAANRGAPPTERSGVPFDTVIPSYERMSAEVAPEVQLRRSGRIALGEDSSSTPGAVKTAFVDSAGIYVVDSKARMLRGYARSGRSTFSLPLGGRSALENPVALLADDDSLLALELTPGIGVHVLSRDGTLRATHRLDIEASTVDLAIASGRLFVTTALRDATIGERRGRFVQRVEADGPSTAYGCIPDARYVRSLERQGWLQMFRFVAVTARDESLYCAQPISPVVQVIDASTGKAGTLRRAPPFYSAPDRDASQTMNSQMVDLFRSSWTMHRRFYPMASGFASVYSTYDTVAAMDRHLLFVCDSGRGAVACATATLTGPPAGLLEPDTLVVLERDKDRAGRQLLGLYLLPMGSRSAHRPVLQPADSSRHRSSASRP